MNTAQQTVETESAEGAAHQSARKSFNYYPLLGLGLTILCAVVVYGALYVFVK